MKDFVERMIKEHADLIIKIDKLNAFMYDNNGHNPLTDIKNNKTQEDIYRNMSEYGNMCIQLRAMKTYAHALECRLNNNGIYFENGEYLERVGVITSVDETKEDKNDE